MAEDVVALLLVSCFHLREMENERGCIHFEKHLHILFGNSLYMASESIRRSFEEISALPSTIESQIIVHIPYTNPSAHSTIEHNVAHSIR